MDDDVGSAKTVAAAEDDDVGSAKTVASDEVGSAQTVASGDVGSAQTVASGDSTIASGAAAMTGAGRELPVVTSDRYRVAGEVGRGGLGRVLRARDEVLERTVALKELLTTDRASHRRFVREALITARLQHPSIIPVYDAGTRTDHSPFYAMKLVAGRPLDRAIAEAKTLAGRLALLPSVIAVVDAIAYAHAQRIIHRDLKPANVLVGEFGETIVIDWGLAKDLSIDDRDAQHAGPYRGDGGATVIGAVLGTPGYMPPEQAAGEDVDERADVYALGAILYHVVAGVVPHQGKSVEEMIEQVIAGRVKPLAEREPHAPSDLAAIVDKAMAREPAARYPSARELADDLRRFQTGQLVGAREYHLGQRLARWIGRHKAISAVTAIATLVLAAFATWSIGRISRERDTAIESANRAIINQARALVDQDPPAALAWLARLSPAGPGWDAARTLAAEALTHPQLDVALQGGRRVEATADGHYAVGRANGSFWIAELANGKAPTLVPFPYRQPVIEMCDDGKRAIVRTSDDDEAKILSIDLPTRSVDHRAYDARAWDDAQLRCKRAHRASWMGSRLHAPGVRMIEPGGKDRLLSQNDADAGWLTSDGNHLVTIDANAEVSRFDLATGGVEVVDAIDPKLLDRPDRAKLETRGVSSADGSVVVVVVAGHAGWCDIAAKSCVAIPGEMDNDSHAIAVAPDGSRAWGETRERSWSIRRDLAWLTPGDAPRGEKFVSPDGAWLAALDHGTLRVQDTASGITRVLHGHTSVEHVQFLSDNRLLTAGSEGGVRIWSLGKPTLRHDMLNFRWVEFSPSTRWFAIDDTDSLVRRPRDGGREDRIEWAGNGIYVIGDSGQIGAVARDGALSIWDGNWRALGKHDGARATKPWMLANGTLVTSSGASLAIWEPAGPRYIEIPDGKSTREEPTLDIDDAGHRALVRCGTASCIVELGGGQVTRLPGSAGAALLARDGRTALTGSPTGEHIVWDVDRMRERRRVHAADPEGGLLGVSRDGRRAMIKSETGVELIDLASGARTPLRSKAPLELEWGEFSPNGRTVLDNLHTLWDVASGEGRNVLEGVGLAGIDLLDDGVLAVTPGAIVHVPDDLPRDPAALLAKLRALPYTLDDHDRLLLR